MKVRFLLYVLSLALGAGLKAQVKPIRKGMLPIQQQRPEPKTFYNVSQLKGKWQEVKRSNIGSKDPLAFSDTLLMQFGSNRVEIKDATSMRMTMKGEAFIDPPFNLMAAGDEYVIDFLDRTRMLLNDGVHSKEMLKKENFYFETLGKVKIPTESLDTPVVVDQKKLEGKWLVYRRQAMAGTVDNDAVVIKSIDIFPSNTIGSSKGQVVCYKSDITESYACQIIFTDGNILVVTDKYVWEFNSYKADGKEFVFGEAGRLLYYAKH